jgi:hypothetical protein
MFTDGRPQLGILNLSALTTTELPTDSGVSGGKDASSGLKAPAIVACQPPQTARLDAPADRLREKFLWLLLFAVIIAIRMPGVLRGRFWAEEGAVFFTRAWDLPWYQALVDPYGGYLSLVGNASAILASHVPLTKACYVSTAIALLVQLCPIAIIFLSKDEWLQPRKVFLAAAFLIATIPMCEGVWLNTVGSQYHLNLCVGLILALSVRGGIVGYFHKGLLAIATLTGLGPACILPLYAIRAFLDRSKQRAVECTIIAAGLLTQFVFFWRPEARHVSGSAVVGIDPLLLLNIFFVKHIVSPILGYKEAFDVAGTWMNDYTHGTFNLIPGAVITLLAFGIFAYMILQTRNSATRWLFCSGMGLALISNVATFGERYLSLGVNVNTRYVFGPQILFELTLLSIFASTKGWKSLLSKWFLIWVAIIGAHEYFWVNPSFAEGPSWRSEVRKWQADPSYRIKIWPATWSIQLKPHGGAPDGASP